MNKVVQICQLTEDIEELISQNKNVNKYLIGPGGSNISGGQK